jgi:hypothetical protein
VLRASERHLGRWLVLAEVAVRAGDVSPLEEARDRAVTGPASSRSAWALVAWALGDTHARARGQLPPLPPTTRPTLELVARLSDRPSADRDTTFLFRMAHAGASGVRPMLEGLVRTLPVKDEASLRAAANLLWQRERGDLREAMVGLAASGRPEELRGMAVAALWDAGARLDDRNGAEALRARATELARELAASRVVGNVAWGTLVAAAARGAGGKGPLLSETAFRWIQWGSVE